VLFVADGCEEKESLKEGRIEEGRIEEGRPEEGRPEEGRPEEGRIEESRPEEGRIEEGRLEEGRIEEGRLEAEKSPSQEGARSCQVRRPGRIVQAQGDGAFEACARSQATRERLQMSDNARSPR